MVDDDDTGFQPEDDQPLSDVGPPPGDQPAEEDIPGLALLEVGDQAFRDIWGSMEDASKDRMPIAIRLACIRRWVGLPEPGPEPELPRNGADVLPLQERAQRVVQATADGSKAAAPWPEPLDLEGLAERKPDNPRFLIPDWLPCGYATLLAGHGGVGKSAIALELAVCIAAGRPWIGINLQRARVLYLSCEDRESVLHWRLARICAALDIEMAGLRGWLQVLDLVGRPSVLWDRDPKSGLTTPPPYYWLQDRITEYQTQVLMLDGIADVFAGRENDRGEVKQFVNAMVGLIPPNDGAVILVGHVAKPASTAGAAGDGYSGSTSWHNSARARWYLYPETEGPNAAEGQGAKPARTGRLILELQKSNLGRTDQSMTFTWSDEERKFVGQSQGTTLFDRRLQTQTEEASVLAAIVGCVQAGIIVPAALQGPRTAYMVLSQRPELDNALKGGTRLSISRFRRHIEVLRQSGQIVEAEYQRENRSVGSQFIPRSTT